MPAVAVDKNLVRKLYVELGLTAKQVALKLHRSESRIRQVIEEEKYYKNGARGIQTKSSARAVTVMSSATEILSQKFLSMAL